MRNWFLKKSLPLLLVIALLVSMLSGAALAAPDYELENFGELTEAINGESSNETEVEPVPELEFESKLGSSQHNIEDGEVPLALQPLLAVQSVVTDTLDGSSPILLDGEYNLTPGATGHIVAASGLTWVKLIGSGVTIVDGQITSPAYTDLTFDFSASPGITVVLENMFLDNQGYSTPVYSGVNTINFAGVGNVLEISGTVVIDYIVGGGSNPASIHVAQGTSLTFTGDGILYFYKSAQGSGVGGNSGELNGDITFAMTGSAFMKGTKQGALIGAGSGANGAPGVPGSVTFNSGTYNLISNSRGAVIGGSAGGWASAGTEVFFNGASVNINVDYSGSAVGGGGYDGGNDAAGGYAYFNGGSLRVYVDKNAAGNTSWGVMSEGINDLAITALKLDYGGNNVYKCVFDTNMLSVPADYFVVDVDGTPFFEGGLHEYSFIQELLDKGEQHTITSTPSNWIKPADPNEVNDSHLYFYLSEDASTLTVNGEEFELTFVSSIVDTPDEHSIGPFVVNGTVTPPTAAAPVISTQPAGAVYSVSPVLTPSVSDLTVAASVSDGGTLSYQWFVNSTNSTNDATAIAGAIGASFTPPIHTAGIAYYFCRVTNTLGEATAYTLSGIAAVTVSITWSRNVDFTWYNTTDATLYIESEAQWNALAWIVSGQIGVIRSYESTYSLNIVGNPPALTDTFSGRTIKLSDTDGDREIVLSDNNFLPVGGRYRYEDQASAAQFDGIFKGSFDGQGNKITGIRADYSVNGGIIGLFGTVDGDGVIENVWVEGSFEAQRVGAVVGGIVGRFGSSENTDGTVYTGYIANCVNAASINATGNSFQGCGGIAGAFWYGAGIFNCANLGSVTTTGYGLGGIVGNMQKGVIDSCYNYGSVIRGSNLWAGIAMVSPTGGATYESYLNNCYYDSLKTQCGVVQSNQLDITSTYTSTTPPLLAAVNVGAMSPAAKATFAAQLNNVIYGTWIVTGGGIIAPAVFGDGYVITVNNATNGAAAATIPSVATGVTTFTVTSPVACTVGYSTDGGATYTRLTATATGVANTYSFTVNAAANMIIAVVVKGDVNFSGGVTVIDAALVKSASQSIISLNSLQSLAADVNSSDTVTAIDAALINLTAQLLSSFSW